MISSLALQHVAMLFKRGIPRKSIDFALCTCDCDLPHLLFMLGMAARGVEKGLRASIVES